MNEAAEREKERLLRDARREVLELQERLRAEAEARGAAVLRAAEEVLAREREAILAKGRKGAEAMRAAGISNVDRAADIVVAKFQGALDA